MAFAALLVVCAPALQAETYLLVSIQTTESVLPPTWLYGYNVFPKTSRYPRDYSVPNSARHWRLKSSLELVRVRPRRLLLRHIDFTDFWAGLTPPDRPLSEDFVIKIRPGAIHFIGDLVVGEDSVVNVWRRQTLLEACAKFPEQMRSRRFILARPLAESDLEFQNPCDPDRLVATEIR